MPYQPGDQPLGAEQAIEMGQQGDEIMPLPLLASHKADENNGSNGAPNLLHKYPSLGLLTPSQSRPLVLAPKKSEPLMRLKPLFIPTASKLGPTIATTPSSSSTTSSVPSLDSLSPPKLQASAANEVATPISESPITPSSSGNTSSIIAGVVDLTRLVRTVSEFPVAQGGLSDIYQGEWRKQSEDAPWETETVKVAIKVLRIFTMRDPDGVRTRKVNSSLRQAFIPNAFSLSA
ncbi:hypothetical protein BJ165DRAFT_237256 [Panaeolus papilionaceus]|nr:hypothetical protein BJ165DRAFT_237256 [Panaeolus papilionaceus]